MSLANSQRTEILVDVELVSVDPPPAATIANSSPLISIVTSPPATSSSIQVEPQPLLQHQRLNHHSNGAVKSYQSTAPITRIRSTSSASDDSVLPDIGYNTSSQSMVVQHSRLHSHVIHFIFLSAPDTPRGAVQEYQPLLNRMDIDMTFNYFPGVFVLFLFHSFKSFGISSLVIIHIVPILRSP